MMKNSDLTENSYKWTSTLDEFGKPQKMNDFIADE